MNILNCSLGTTISNVKHSVLLLSQKRKKNSSAPIKTLLVNCTGAVIG